MRLQVMAREGGRGFLHKGRGGCYRYKTLGEHWALCYRYTFLHLPRVPPVFVTVRLVFIVSLLTTGWLLRRLFLVVARAAGVVYGGSYTRSLSTIAFVACRSSIWASRYAWPQFILSPLAGLQRLKKQ